MTNTYDIAIIGSGVAGTFAAWRITEKNPDIKTILIDGGRPPGKRKRAGDGFLGWFPTGDGKLYPSNLDSISNLVDGRRLNPAYKWVWNKLSEVNGMKLIKDTLPLVSAQKKIKEEGFEIKTNDYVQWKPDSVHNLSKLVTQDLEENKNLKFNFDNEVFSFLKKGSNFLISTAEGDIICKKIILCAGRSGWRWVNSLYRDLGIAFNDNYAKFGVRLEIASQYLKDFNRSHCSLIKSGTEIGPFSWSGTVIPEDHCDLVISAFRSNEERWKSDKVSFSLICSREFEDQGVYQTDRLGKLAFLLFNDRVSRERIKIFLKKESQLCLVPEYNWLEETLIEMEKFIPNLLNRGYFHVPNILPLASEIRLDSDLESEIDGLYVAGESANISGILGAAVSGTICGDSVSKG